jgi:hypothetical protein
MMGTPESAFSRSDGRTITPVHSRTTNSPLTRAWTPIASADSFWVRARAPFARRRYANEFERFKAFVLAFSSEKHRPLNPGETQAMADDAVRLGLLEVDPTAWTAFGRPMFYEFVPGYKRRRLTFHFREWLVVHEHRISLRAKVGHFL